ncbi:uncharacterized protein LOC117329634 [Pecten maximus]|uniref:uncharacterized protein LOC117329634 n=1 Tax=Pecten maximus TaxID=6579 RepID=UPI0014583715|nr:uncharacterized protein LOC117329634 [Pecten maximus]
MTTPQYSLKSGVGSVAATGTLAERPTPRERIQTRQPNSTITKQATQSSTGAANDISYISDLRKLLQIASDLKEIDLNTALDDYKGLLKQTRQEDRVSNEETILETRRERLQSLTSETIKNERERYEVLMQANERLQKEKNDLENRYQQIERICQGLDVENKNQKEEMKGREEELRKVMKERDAAMEEKKLVMTRLSKEMGMKLSDNNPAIADLSDPNRATKLGEKYNELYDDEWTDALEKLCDVGYDEKAAIGELLGALKTCYRICVDLSEKQMTSLQRTLLNPVLTETTKQAWAESNNTTIAKPALKQLKECRKEISLYDVVQKITEHVIKQYGRKAEHIPVFFKKCIELCWLMCLQNPPVVIGEDAAVSGTFNAERYKPYTNTGTIVSYNVWPPLLHHQNGALLVKGVVQPFKEEKKKELPKKEPPSSNKTDLSKTYHTPSSGTKSLNSAGYAPNSTQRQTASPVVPQTKDAWGCPVTHATTTIHYPNLPAAGNRNGNPNYQSTTTTQPSRPHDTYTQRQVPPYYITWHEGKQYAVSNGDWYDFNIFRMHYGIK